MAPGPRLADEQILDLVVAVGCAHVSITRGALPSVVPARASLDDAGNIVLDSAHPGLVAGAERGDIVAIQVDAVHENVAWSLLVTGPLEERRGKVVMSRAKAMLTSDCLSSGHGVDPLLRRGPARRT